MLRVEMSAKKEIGREELSGYLHLPEKAVAKKLGICLTSLKKVCRLHGITRWPYRKLKSLDKRIHKIEASLAAGEGGADEQASLREKLDVRYIPSPSFGRCFRPSLALTPCARQAACLPCHVDVDVDG